MTLRSFYCSLCLWLLFSFSGVIAQNTAWTAPPNADSLTSPIPLRTEDLQQGALIYKKNCAFCHGSSGKGDGMAAKALNPPPKSFHGLIEQQSDGVLFWKVTEGRAGMPSFKDKLSALERWQVVLYIRTLVQSE